MAKLDLWQLGDALHEVENAVIILQALRLQAQEARLTDLEEELDQAVGDAGLALDRITQLQKRWLNGKEASDGC